MRLRLTKLGRALAICVCVCVCASLVCWGVPEFVMKYRAICFVRTRSDPSVA